MRINNQFEHLGAKNIILEKPEIWDEIIEVFTCCSLTFGKSRPSQIKHTISTEFNRLGWADKVPINKQTNLTISFIKNRTGLCVQFGNVARTYSDILKLTYLTTKNIIDVGVIIVPNKKESVLLGANYANFNRLSQEIEVFSEIIHIPLMILGVTN